MKRSKAPSLRTSARGPSGGYTSATPGSGFSASGASGSSSLLQNTSARGRGRTALVRKNKPEVPPPIVRDPTPPPTADNQMDVDDVGSGSDEEEMFERSPSPERPVGRVKIVRRNVSAISEKNYAGNSGRNAPSIYSSSSKGISDTNRASKDRASTASAKSTDKKRRSSTSSDKSNEDNEVKTEKYIIKSLKKNHAPEQVQVRRPGPALTEASRNVAATNEDQNDTHRRFENEFQSRSSRVLSNASPETGRRVTSASNNYLSSSPSLNGSPQRQSIRLRRPASILDSDSDDDDNARVRQKSGKKGNSQVSSDGEVLSRSLLDSSVSILGAMAMPIVSTNNTTMQSNLSNSERISSASASCSSSLIANRSKYDKNDPDWIRFLESVQTCPNTAHEKLTTELLQLEGGSTSTSALIGKLIYRTLAELDEGNLMKDELQKCAFTIIRSVLHLTIRADNNNEVVSECVNMMFTELRHFPSQVLHTVAESCLEYIKKDRHEDGSLPPRWIETFGKIISVMIGKGDIKHETDILDGRAYREHIVGEICRLNWTTDNTASLIAVLREIQGIEDFELQQILCQVKSCMKGIRGSAFPPIIHQLLLLSGSKCPFELLSISAEYFKNMEPDNTSLEAKQKRNALGTVVFHFLETARHSDSLVRAVVKIVKASLFDFGKVMSPFVLSVVLGLTSLEHAKSQIIEPLRTSIMNYFYSMHISKMSYWHQQTVGSASSNDIVTETFRAILETGTTTAAVDIMLDGLQTLGIGLLRADSSQNKYPHTLEPCQTLGTFILKSVIRRNEDQLSTLMDLLMKESLKSVVHIECLAGCMEMKTRKIIQPPLLAKTCDIIRHLPMMESDSAQLIVKGLATAFQLSYILLDQLMIILRKTIWKSVEARKTAARIMIILLSNSKVVGEIPCSQYSESQRLFDSQNQPPDMSQIPDSQPLCMEVLALAKRIFSQQCQIRKELYLGYHTVVRRNPGLCELICGQVLSHGKRYLTGISEGGDEIPSIDLKATLEFTLNALNPVTVKEELGFLVQSLSLVARRSEQAFAQLEDGPPIQVEHITALLTHWIKAVLELTQETISQVAAEAVSGAGGSWPLDTIRYVESAFTIQVLQIIEALIEHLNYNSRQQDERTVKKLFEKIQTLEPILQKKREATGNKKGKGAKGKGKSKGKSKEKDGNVNDDGDSIADTMSEASGSQGVGFKFKKPEGPKKLVHFHIFTLDGLLDMFSKLYKADRDKYPLSTVHQADPEFEKLLLNTVKQKLSSFQKKEALHERTQRPEKVALTFADIASAIWNGFYNLNQDGDREMLAAAASGVIELRLEVINEITKHLCNSYNSVCCHLIKSMGDEIDDVSYDAAFPKFFNSWKTLQSLIPSSSATAAPDQTTADEPDRNLHKHLFEILHWFSLPLYPDNEDCALSSEVLTWLWGFMASSSGKGDQAADFVFADSVISCWLAFYGKCRSFLEQPGQSQHDMLSLAKTVRGVLGNNDETGSEVFEYPEMWIINNETAPSAVVSIMEYIETVMTYISALIVKLRAPHFGENASFENAIKIRERCFGMMNQILSVSFELVPSAFPAGLCTNTMLRVIPQIFNVMTGFGEYFMELSKTKQDFSFKGFTEPVSRIGKTFTDLITNMITHIESVQRQQVVEEGAKLKPGSKKKGISNTMKNLLLKDTKLIPNMVFNIEKYDQKIIQLSNKLKDKKGARLLVGMKLVSGRDFKIDSAGLMEALNQNRPRSVQDISSVPDDETVFPTATRARNKSPVAGPSRPRKGRKRKNTDEEESAGVGNDDDDVQEI